MKINNRMHKITGVSITILFLISSLTAVSLGICEEKNGSVPMLYSSSEKIDSLPYQGHLRIYVVEPESRWNNYDGEPYHFGFLDFAYNDVLSIDYLDTYSDTIIWNGNQAGFGDIQENNIIVMAALFNPEIHKGYSNPPTNFPFEAHYVDAAAAATPGNSASNTVNEEFTHTVFVEEATAEYCPYCPAMANALYTVYDSGDYPFYFTALITKDKQRNVINQVALDHLVNEYNHYAYPTAHFDGGYKTLVGGYDNPDIMLTQLHISMGDTKHWSEDTITLIYFLIGSDLQVNAMFMNLILLYHLNGWGTVISK